MIWWPKKLATAWEWSWGRVNFRYCHLSGGHWTKADFLDRFSVKWKKSWD